MNAFDLVDVRAPITIGDRGFSVRRITLGDVLRLLVRFDDHVRNFVSQEKPDAIAFLQALTSNDTADLLGFFVEPRDVLYLRANLVSLAKRAELVTLIRSLNDIGRIWNSLKISEPRAPAEAGSKVEPIGEQPKVPALVYVLDRIAERYGIDPLTILGWPYEAFLTIVDAVEEASRVARDSEIDPDLLDDSKIPVLPFPDSILKVH